MPNLDNKPHPEMEHSNYRTCVNCKSHINKVSNKSGLCQKCYKIRIKIARVCPKCEIKKEREQFTPTSIYCKECLSKYTNEKWIKLKKEALKYKGEKCEVCGYSKCIAALEFHHVNMGEKEFSISKVRTLSLDKIKPELDKCRLLCANCHREQHYIYNKNQQSAFLTS